MRDDRIDEERRQEKNDFVKNCKLIHKNLKNKIDLSSL